MKKTSTRLMIVLSLLFATTGCATTIAEQQLSEEDRSKITAVYISDDIKKSPGLYFYGPALQIGAGYDPKAGEVIKAFVEKNDVYIEKIVYEELSATLRNSGPLPITDSADSASATMHVQIPMYGFSIPNGFSGSLVPILYVECFMTDKSGAVIWKGSDAIHPLGNPADSVDENTLLANAQLIEKQWRIGAQDIAKHILKQLMEPKYRD